MGDVRRFDLFARFIASNFYKGANIADVAGGKGYLRAALHEYGFQTVTSWDRRHGNAKGRPGTRYGYFTQDTADAYDLVVGMHPDGATDHIIRYAIKHRVPFVVCPCCIIPSAVTYWGKHSIHPWIAHLKNMATKAGFEVSESQLKMTGRNAVLVGLPYQKIK